jgi:hypothetical protein
MKNLMMFNTTVQNAFEGSNEKFISFNELLLDAALGEVKEYSAKDANKKIVEKFRAALGIEPTDRPQHVRRAIRANKDLVFTLIEETVEEVIITGWMENPFFMQFVETKNLALGDENDFYVEDDSILSVSKVSGNHHNMIRQRLGAGRHFSVAGEWYGIKIYSDFERVLTGAEDWAAFVAKVAEAINRYLYDALYAALRGAKENLGANWVKNGALDATNKATLVKLCQDISMATGSDVTIFGARTALSSLTAMADVNWLPEAAKKEYYNNAGILGNFEGFSVAEIGQGLKRGANINSATVEYQLDTDRLYIIPTSVANRFIKLVNYGETQISQVTDRDVNRDMSYEYEVLYKMGINVILNTVFGVWEII